MYISEVAERSGLSTHTLRYYEKEGLLRNIRRNESGRRVYGKSDLEWLDWIQRLKSTGMLLEDIKRFADLRAMGDRSIPARKNMLITHSEKLKSDIQSLQDELEIVQYKVKLYQQKENTFLT